jgi:creatinine amidohydrolase
LIEPFIRHGARAISILNTGVSTERPIGIAVSNLQARHGVQIAVADIRRLGMASNTILEQKVGGHGDEREPSNMLEIDPTVVRLERARQDYGHAMQEPATVFYRPVRFSDDPNSGSNYSATGVRGDPTLASAEKGRIILAAQIADLVEGLRKLDPALS